MCRSIADGGRRCPSSDPAYRAAYRKARRAANAARKAVIGQGGTTVLTPDYDFDAEQLNEVAADVSTLTSYRRHNQSFAEVMDTITEYSTMTDDEIADELGQDTVDAGNRLKAQMGKDSVVEATEAAVVQVGYTVAAEAERRAGVSVATIAAQSEMHDIETTKKLEDKNHEIVENLDQQRALTQEAHRGVDRATKHYEHMKQLYGAGSYDTREAFKDVEKAQHQLKTVDDSDDMKVLKDQHQQLSWDQASLRNDLANGMHQSEHREALTKLSDAYLETLSEMRSLGGDTTWSDRTAKKAREGFQEAAQVFPSDWIDQHNAGEPVYARISQRRAHYADAKYQQRKKKVRNTNTKIYDSYEDFDQHEYFGRGPQDHGRVTWREATEEERAGAAVGPADTVMIAEYWDVHESHYGDVDPDRPPGKRGWQLYRTQEGQGDLIWRRPSTRMQTVSAQIAPEITTNPDWRGPSLVDRSELPSSETKPSFSTSSHELSHRFERVVPGIGVVEQAFLHRRTTNENGEQEPLQQLYPGASGTMAKEVSRPDSFVHSYIGKDYGNGRYYEVLSMGVESVFSGDNGGLIGAGRYHADTDHRAFVLGTLATVGRTSGTAKGQSDQS